MNEKRCAEFIRLVHYNPKKNDYEITFSGNYSRSDLDNTQEPFFSLVPLGNGEIIGINRYSRFPHDLIIAKYNRTKRAFEYLSDGSRLLTGLNLPTVYAYVVDNNQNLWMTNGTALYGLDLNTLESIEINILDTNSQTYLKDIALGPNEMLYLLANGQSEIIRFSLATGKIVDRLAIDLEIQKSYYNPDLWLTSDIFIDRSQNLWVNDYGWLDNRREWHQILTRFAGFYGYLENAPYNRHGWLQTEIMLQSSDGRLWFSSSNGMVSLDPEKGEWCWFTTYQSNIVEDANHNLWMIADGKLYKYPLNP